MTPAYIYIRFSSKRQEKGESRERQLSICQALAASKGYEVVEIVEDLGLSAWTGSHLRDGALGKFAERVRAHEIPREAVLIVEKLDRLSRQEPRVTLRWMEDMCEAGLRIVTADNSGRVYDDATLRSDLLSIIEVLLKGKLANDESTQKSDRVSHTKAKRLEDARNGGKKISAKCPGWLTLSEDRMSFSVVEERAEIVRMIYQMSADGMGPRWIAKVLNERGIPAWGKPSRGSMAAGWEVSAVKLILRQPAVEGDYVTGFSNTSAANKGKPGERLVGYYGHRIVDADLVARARASLDGRRTGGRYRCEAANLFAGLVRCAECEGKLNMRSNEQGVRYLQCVAATRARGCSSRAMFRYAEFEFAALDAMLAYALDDRYFKRPEAVGPLIAKLADARKSLADKREAVDRLIDLLSRVASPSTEARLAALEAEIAESSREIGEHERALESARGAVSDAEHLERVMAVREALEDADKATREAARLKVQEALKSVVTMVVAHERDDLCGDLQRSLTVFIAGGARAMRFVGGRMTHDTSALHGIVSAHARPGGRVKAQLATYERRLVATLPEIVPATLAA